VADISSCTPNDAFPDGQNNGRIMAISAVAYIALASTNHQQEQENPYLANVVGLCALR
jgi:hypothetical protein